MKKISIVVPCYNEQDNVRGMSEALLEQMKKLSEYDYEILFIDNCSEDNTRNILREICSENKKIKAIFNLKNFGQFNSPYYALCQTTGECAISICCDFQDPPEMIPKFIKEWEQGYKIVCGVKTSSREGRLMYTLRSIYYKLIKRLSRVDQIEHFTGFGLYDRSFIDILRKLDDPTPFIRGIVAELGPNIKKLEYEQAKRKAGRTSNNFFSLYDAAMLSFTSYTKAGVRSASFLGIFMCAISFISSLIFLVIRLFSGERINGVAPIILTLVFLGGLQLFFIGFLGEYIMSMNARTMKRPLVIEEERINFE